MDVRLLASPPVAERRVRPGDVLAALSGAALAASLWLPWYSVAVRVPAGDLGPVRLAGEATAWDAVPWRARAVAVVALALGAACLARMTGRAAVASSTVMGLAAVGGAAAITTLVLRPDVVDAVDAAGGTVSPGAGLVVALAACVLAAAGSWAAAD
jgi:hypothetical protein